MTNTQISVLTRRPADAHLRRNFKVGNVDDGRDGVSVVHVEHIQNGELSSLLQNDGVRLRSTSHVPHQASVIHDIGEHVDHIPLAQDLRGRNEAFEMWLTRLILFTGK